MRAALIFAIIFSILFILILSLAYAEQTTHTFYVVGDTFLKDNGQNENEGTNTHLRLQHPSRSSHVIVMFAQQDLLNTIGADHIVSADLELFIETNYNNWGSGTMVDVHRMTADWQEYISGSPAQGVTWNCRPVDSNLGNTNPNCEDLWEGGYYDVNILDSVLHQNAETGWKTFDVTADLQAIVSGANHYGWLIRKRNGADQGSVDYTSLQGTPANKPRLVVVTEQNTLPSCTASPDPSPNEYGWNNTAPVTVHCICTDPDPGDSITFCTPDQYVNSDTNGQVVTCIVEDSRGGSSSCDVTVKIDTVPPTVVITSPEDQAIVATTQVLVTGNVSDDRSGVLSLTCNEAPVTPSGGSFSHQVALIGGTNTITAKVTDYADNPPATDTINVTGSVYQSIRLIEDFIPSGFSVEYPTVQVIGDFEVPKSLVQVCIDNGDQCPPGYEVEWSVSAQPTINTGLSSFTIGPYVDPIGGPFEIDVRLEGETEVEYATFHIERTYDGTNEYAQTVADDRYETTFQATLVLPNGSQEFDTLGGPILSVGFTLPSVENREAAAQVVADQYLAQESVRSMLQLSEADSLVFLGAYANDHAYTHVYYDQYHQGIRVMYGNLIVQVDDLQQSNIDITDYHFANVVVPTITPQITSQQAMDLALNDLAPHGELTEPQTYELLIWQLEDGTFDLGYYVNTSLTADDPLREIAHVIDAVDGGVLSSWNTAMQVTGTARTQYSGQKSINTSMNNGVYELIDDQRGKSPDKYNRVFDLLKQHEGGIIYNDNCSGCGNDNVWGDFTQIGSSDSTQSTRGQTAAADAAYALKRTWDYFTGVHGRNGIIGTPSKKGGNGLGVRIKVHWSGGLSFNIPAKWDTTNKEVYLSDVDGVSWTSLDIVAHELSHGLAYTIGRLTGDSPETEALSEANADILATMVEYQAGEGDWTMHDRIPPGFSHYYRYLDKPSRGTCERFIAVPPPPGGSVQGADWWTPSFNTTYDGFEHCGAGVANHFFYYLVNGVPEAPRYNSSPDYLPLGALGITRGPARQIWYRAVVDNMAANTNFCQARVATLQAAQAKYGACSSKYKAVNNAWKAVNVARPRCPKVTGLSNCPFTNPVE